MCFVVLFLIVCFQDCYLPVDYSNTDVGLNSFRDIEDPAEFYAGYGVSVVVVVATVC